MTEEQLLKEVDKLVSKTSKFVKATLKTGKVNCVGLGEAMDDSRRAYKLIADYGQHVVTYKLKK